MLHFTVDSERCVKCGECAKDCPYELIDMVDETPTMMPESEARCIKCQHCMVVCKSGALSILGLDSKGAASIKGKMPEPEKMETLIKGRRTTRRFRKDSVDPALITRMLEATSCAPTGLNSRATLLTVVDDAETMDVIRKKTITAALKGINEGKLPKQLEFLEGYFKSCEGGRDAIFRNAPHMLIASSPKNAPSPVEDCLIAMSYFELLAYSNGLGAIWAGLGKIAITVLAPEIPTLLGIPEDNHIGYVMAFGKPAMKYHRAIQIPEPNINRVSL